MRLPVLASLIALAACSVTTQPPTPPMAITPLPAGLEPTWRPHLAWTHSSRGGAAVRGPGYEHVVAVEPRDPRLAAMPAVDQDLTSARFGEMVARLASPATPMAVTPGTRSSPPSPWERLTPRQLAAWTKYCAGRGGMTADDWTIIAATSGHPFDVLEAARHASCAALRNDFLRPTGPVQLVPPPTTPDLPDQPPSLPARAPLDEAPAAPAEAADVG